MSWANIIATGSGAVSWRVRIEGFPYEAVSKASMETTGSDGRVRYEGLNSDGWTFTEDVNLVTAEWQPKGLNIQVRDVDGRWTEAFRPPTNRTWLASDATDTNLSWTVKSVVGFPTSGRVWCDSEVAAYTGVTTAGPTFNFGVVGNRGIWQSLAQYHYVPDGERARYPEVTDWPVIREGRRVYVYAYGSGDSPTGDGTLIWTGIVSREPTYNGLSWSLQVDPLSRLFESELGADLEDPTPIRGIYYSGGAPLVLAFREGNAADPPPSGSVATQHSFAISGFWENQEDFCADLTTEIQSQLTAASFNQTDVYAVVTGDTWAIEYVTDGTTARWMRFYVVSATDRLEEVYYAAGSRDGRFNPTVTTSTRYRIPQINAPFGQVPRSCFGGYERSLARVATLSGTELVNVDTSTYPNFRVYLGGVSAVTSNTETVSLSWDSNTVTDASAESLVAQVDTVNTSDRYIDLLRPVGGRGSLYASAGPGQVELRFGRNFGTGHLGDMLDAIAAEVPQFLNTGAVPDFRAADFESIASTDIPYAAASNVLAQNRTLSVFAPVTLADVIEQECRILGCYPCYSSNGKITFRRLRLPALSEAGGTTVDNTNIVTDDSWPQYEPQVEGSWASVRFRGGYDPVEEEHTGRPVLVRDVSAYGQSTLARTLEIAPYTIDAVAGYDYLDVEQAASGVLGTFGGPYVYVTCEVNLTLFDLLVGDVVSITSTKIPADDGTKGVTGKIGIVVSRSWEPRAARGELTFLVTNQRIGGYTPASRISGAISGTSGTTGPFSVTLSTSYFPSGVNADGVFAVGDKIRLFEWNSTTTTFNETGTISTVAANSVVFSTDNNWSHASASNWCMGIGPSTVHAAGGQGVDCFIARTTSRVVYSGSETPAFTFGV